MNLEKQATKVCCVINADINVKDLDKFSLIGLSYYAILHDKDVDKDGVLKTKHYHLILVRHKYNYLKYFLSRVCELLNVKDNQVSIMPCDNLTCAIQYLIHKNDSDKHQYSPMDIYTNVSSNDLNSELSINVNDISLNVDSLRDLFISCNFNKLKIISLIGVGRYQAMYKSINDIYDLIRAEYAQSQREKLQDHIEKGAIETLENAKKSDKQ